MAVVLSVWAINLARTTARHLREGSNRRGTAGRTDGVQVTNPRRELTPDPGRQAPRRLAAAQANLVAGTPTRVLIRALGDLTEAGTWAYRAGQYRHRQRRIYRHRIVW